MAKQSAQAQATPQAPQAAAESTAQAVAAKSTAAASIPASAFQSKEQHDTVEVIEWGNGDAASVTTKPAEGVKAKPEEDAPPAAKKGAEGKEDGEATTEDKVEDTTEEPTPSDKPQQTEEQKAAAAKRAELFARLDQEKTRVEVETRAKEAQDAAAKARKELDDLKAAPLAKKLEWLGIDPDELADKLLIKADDVKFTPPPKQPEKPPEDPEIADLKRWAKERREAEQAQQVQQAHQQVAEHLKDAETPLVHGLDAYGRVLSKAHAAWTLGGKAGHVRDYLEDAAGIVEAELAKEHPKLAARVAASRPAAEETTETVAETPPARPQRAPVAVGKRTPARPDARPNALPDDRAERDAAIRAEMAKLDPKGGWA